jgi:hypothetical protein
LAGYDDLGLHRVAATVRQQLASEGHRALARAIDLGDVSIKLAALRNVFQQERRVAQDHAQQVVEVVCDAASEASDGLHLLRVLELLLSPTQALLGIDHLLDVGARTEPARASPCRVLHRKRTDQTGAGAAVDLLDSRIERIGGA